MLVDPSSNLGTMELQSPAKNRAQPIFFRFALKNIESGVLDMKDIVARAIIYSTLYYYVGSILSSRAAIFVSKKHQ